MYFEVKCKTGNLIIYTAIIYIVVGFLVINDVYEFWIFIRDI